MSWFQLDPNSVIRRVQANGKPAEIPSLGTSLRRGTVGFTLLSLAGFAPWVIAGSWFYRNMGETGLYAVCALVFIGLSGPLLHRLIIGPVSLPRFYKLFSAAFAAYAILWIIGWMTLRGHPGSLAGLFAGTAAMGWMLACAFDAKESTLKVVAALFVLNAIGYFVGGWVEGTVIQMKEFPLLGQTMSRSTHLMIAKSLWGVFYGLGFGAGMGFAFHICQKKTRTMLTELKITSNATTNS